jgi:hypothetical protein
MHDCLWYKKRGLLYDTITQHAIIYGTMIWALRYTKTYWNKHLSFSFFYKAHVRLAYIRHISYQKSPTSNWHLRHIIYQYIDICDINHCFLQSALVLNICRSNGLPDGCYRQGAKTIRDEFARGRASVLCIRFYSACTLHVHNTYIHTYTWHTTSQI